jgi:hypothetical protein
MAFDGFLNRALGRTASDDMTEDPVETKIDAPGMAVLAPASLELDDEMLATGEGAWLGGQACDLERWA